jgi:Carbohydrate-selective porin, OprB family
MAKLLSNNFLSPILVGFAVWIAAVSPTTANPLRKDAPQTTGTQSSKESEATAITSSVVSDEQVNQARESTEIKPGDWAYQTLQALSTKYDCSNTTIGNKVLSREEFATSLNGCVQSIEQLVARRKPRKILKKRRVAPAPEMVPPVAPEVIAPVAPAPVQPPAPIEPAEPEVSQQDLDRLKQLVQSFSSELQGVDARVQAVDDKVAKLKAQSFSTTTKLNGEAIFTISGYGGRNTALGANGTTGNILGDRVRLNFDTSFTGKDLLRTRLQSRNITSFNSGVTGTNMTRLGYDGGDITGGGFTNSTAVSLLKYNFPLSPETKVLTAVIGSEYNDELYNFNPALESSGGGALSRFGRFNPVYRLSNDGATLGVDHKFSNDLGLALAYSVPGANNVANPAQGSGLFNGSNVLFGQLRFTPMEDLNLGLIYARSYHADGSNLSGGTGSSAANSPFGAVATSANNYSFLASYKLSPTFILSGWAGFTEATREATGGGTASSSNYAVSLAFPDFGQKGNNLAFVLGIPPKLNARSTTPTTTNPDTSYHLEALYKLKLSDNVSITPGIILITNPEHNSANPTEYVGSIRTTFKF